MKVLLSLLITACLCCLVSGCRCDSGMEGSTDGPDGVSGTPTTGVQAGPGAAGSATGDGKMKWCRACAKAGFMACKRMDGTQSEDVLRRKAEVAACADVGIAEPDCTTDKLSMVDCGSIE